MKLLTPEMLQRIPAYRLQTSLVARGSHRGERKSSKLGTSLEFSDYRLYAPGDDPRQIDWNAFARTKRHYIKRYMDEQEFMLSLYLDVTSSIITHDRKREVTMALTGALGYMGLCGDDRVSVHPVGGGTVSFPFRKGRPFASHLLRYLERLDLTNDRVTQSFSLGMLEKLPQKSGMTIIISDFMEPLEELTTSLKKLQSRRQQLRLIQVLADEELHPAYSGDLKLIDSETSNEQNVSMDRSVLESYEQRLKDHQESLSHFCSKRGIGLVTCATSESVDSVLFTVLRKKGWIG
ncbi:MAG: DUF58 domain-containing protein [Anaerobacillus sp.]